MTSITPMVKKTQKSWWFCKLFKYSHYHNQNIKHTVYKWQPAVLAHHTTIVSAIAMPFPQTCKTVQLYIVYT